MSAKKRKLTKKSIEMRSSGSKVSISHQLPSRAKSRKSKQLSVDHHGARSGRDLPPYMDNATVQASMERAAAAQVEDALEPPGGRRTGRGSMSVEARSKEFVLIAN